MTRSMNNKRKRKKLSKKYRGQLKVKKLILTRRGMFRMPKKMLKKLLMPMQLSNQTMMKKARSMRLTILKMLRTMPTKKPSWPNSLKKKISIWFQRTQMSQRLIS